MTQDGYEYVAIVFGTVYLIPQIMLGYKLKCLKHVSTLSMITLTFSSMLWAYYLYVAEAIYYSYATAFVCINAIAIICMKYTYYVKDLKSKLDTIDANPI